MTNKAIMKRRHLKFMKGMCLKEILGTIKELEIIKQEMGILFSKKHTFFWVRKLKSLNLNKAGHFNLDLTIRLLYKKLKSERGLKLKELGI